MSLIVPQWSINGNFEGAIMFYNILEQGKETVVAYLLFFLNFLLPAALHNKSWNGKLS